MSPIDLPSKEELIARSEHLSLAIETAFREWLMFHLLARSLPPELLIQLMRINQNIDKLKLKKAMLKLKERELDLKVQIANDNRDYGNKELSLRDREVVVKEQRLEFQKSQASPKTPSEPVSPIVEPPINPRTVEPTTEDLVAMEWDLRSFLQFGDLRHFDWFTGLRTIYFPDRSAHPGPPIPNYPDDMVRTESMVARPDGVFILLTPISQLPKDWDKQKLVEKPPYTPVPPVTENGQVQWQRFIQPAHTDFPYNTVLPADWVYGDPVPGMPEEFA